MAIQYVTKQDTRKNGNGQWYGRAVHPSTVDLNAVAERIQHNCSMTKGDVLAVLTEMISVMNDELQNSNKVRLDGFGTFYISLRTKGAASEKEFNAGDNIVGYNVKFLAQGKRDGGGVTRTFLKGVKAVKAV